MGRFSNEEKQELIRNLKFEVTHRTIQFKRDLEAQLETFKMNQEVLLSHIPKSVRNMTLRDFGRLYNGNVQAAVRGFQKAKFVSERGEQALEKIDKSTRKRKWVESQDNESDMSQSSSNPEIPPPRAPKTPRLMPSPNKVAGPSNALAAHRARLAGHTGELTPGKSRTIPRPPGSPSPQKVRPPFNNTASLKRAPAARPPSPLKHGSSTRPQMPTSATFKPSLPKAPTYPRLPLKEDNRQPHPATVTTSKSADDVVRNPAGQTLRRTKSTISVRRDPSFATSHTRTDSQISFYSSTHSRTNSESKPSSPPHSQDTQVEEDISTPIRSLSSSALTRSYSVTISTKDGHLLEFDPLQTSPGQLEALEGVSNSAKKQTKDELRRVMNAVVNKWKLV